MNKGLKITIGILTLGVTGFGIYMLYKKVLKPKIQALSYAPVGSKSILEAY